MYLALLELLITSKNETFQRLSNTVTMSIHRDKIYYLVSVATR